MLQPVHALVKYASCLTVGHRAYISFQALVFFPGIGIIEDSDN